MDHEESIRRYLLGELITATKKADVIYNLVPVAEQRHFDCLVKLEAALAFIDHVHNLLTNDPDNFDFRVINVMTQHVDSAIAEMNRANDFVEKLSQRLEHAIKEAENIAETLRHIREGCDCHPFIGNAFFNPDC